MLAVVLADEVRPGTPLLQAHVLLQPMSGTGDTY